MNDYFGYELDRTDLKILRSLQDDGRLTNASIAKRANISPATCHRRTQRLVDAGVVAGTTAVIAPERVGLGVLVMVAVVLDRSTPDSFTAFEEAAKCMKEVLDCNLVSGDFDYLLKIRVRDLSDFNRLHSQQLIALPGVRQARSYFVLKEVKENTPLSF